MPTGFITKLGLFIFLLNEKGVLFSQFAHKIFFFMCRQSWIQWRFHENGYKFFQLLNAYSSHLLTVCFKFAITMPIRKAADFDWSEIESWSCALARYANEFFSKKREFLLFAEKYMIFFRKENRPQWPRWSPEILGKRLRCCVLTHLHEVAHNFDIAPGRSGSLLGSEEAYQIMSSLPGRQASPISSFSW